MSDTIKQKKHRFLKVELAVLVCVICIWIVKSLSVDIDNAKIEIEPQLAQAYANQGRGYDHGLVQQGH